MDGGSKGVEVIFENQLSLPQPRAADHVNKISTIQLTLDATNEL